MKLDASGKWVAGTLENDALGRGDIPLPMSPAEVLRAIANSRLNCEQMTNEFIEDDTYLTKENVLEQKAIFDADKLGRLGILADMEDQVFGIEPCVGLADKAQLYVDAISDLD